MPLSISRRDRRRAPTTEIAPAQLHTTNVARSRKDPSEAMNAYEPASAVLADGSYFDGHFAITPFGSVANPLAVRRPFKTTSASSLNVSGTIPVYEASTTLPLFWTLNLYSSVLGRTRIDPG